MSVKKILTPSWIWRYQSVRIRDRIEGLADDWGPCHLSIGIFEKCVTIKFLKYGLNKVVFCPLSHFMHTYAIKATIFTKLGECSQNTEVC